MRQQNIYIVFNFCKWAIFKLELSENKKFLKQNKPEEVIYYKKECNSPIANSFHLIDKIEEQVGWTPIIATMNKWSRVLKILNILAIEAIPSILTYNVPFRQNILQNIIDNKVITAYIALDKAGKLGGY